MARQILPIAGAIVGGAFGMPQLGFAIGSIIGNAVDPVQIQGPKIGDLQVQTSRDGVPRPIVFGKAAVAGNIIDRGTPRIVKKKEKAGKGGPVTVSERAYLSFAVRICEGPVIGVSRVWENEKLVYDGTAANTIPIGSVKFLQMVTFYLGGETQLPDPTLEAIHGVGFTPAHRGTCYAVFKNKDVTDTGGAIPQYRFEIDASDPDFYAASVYSLIDCVGSVGTEVYHDTQGLTWTNSSDPPDPVISMAGFGAVVQSIDFATGSAFAGSIIGHTESPTLTPSKITFDGFVNFRSVSGTRILMYAPSNSGNNSYCLLLTAGKLSFAIYSGGTTPVIVGPTVAINTEYHYEVSFDGATGDYYLFVDGTLYGTYNIAQSTVELINVTYGGALAYQLDGYMTQMRITLDQRHTSSFVKPSLVSSLSKLDTIVTTVSARIGVSSTEIDVTELTDEVSGFVISGLYSASEILRSLQRAYFFDPVEVDGKIKFRKRGAAVVGTIDETSMIDSPEETTREQEYEFPKKLHLSYQNSSIDYAPTQANAERSSPDVRVTTEMSLEVATVLTADQAADIANKMIKTAWIDAMGEVKFQLPDNYSWITPTDCLTLTYRGRTVRVRVDKIESSEGYLNITSRFDRISAYASDITGAPIQSILPPSETAPGTTYFELMNIPALIDQHDLMGYYVIAAGQLDGWLGAVIQRSIDAGSTYLDIEAIGTGTAMGILTQALPNASEYATDTTNKLTITLYGPASNALDTISETQFLQEYNAALVGDEIIQFKTAVEIVEGTWELTTLNRGRQGTSTAAHIIGERFVLLEGAHFVECSSALIGSSLTHRAVAYTTDPTLATPETEVFTPARSQQEFAPIDLVLSKAGNILTASWTPRHRFGTAITPVASINFTGFNISIVGSSTIILNTTLNTISQDITGLGTVTVTVAGTNRITGTSTLTAVGVI